MTPLDRRTQFIFSREYCEAPISCPTSSRKRCSHLVAKAARSVMELWESGIRYASFPIPAWTS